MIQRITTNGMMTSYKQSLMKSYNNLASASEKVTTERNFNSYAEDPTKASQAFQLRRNRWNTENQIANSNQVIHKYQQAWDCLNTTYEDLAVNLADYSSLRAMNGADLGGRQALGQVIQGAAKSVVETMNAKYGDNFVFNGADGQNVPFAIEGNGTITFRGYNVTQPNANDPTDMSIFEDMIDTEHTYVDLGMGMKENPNNNELISSSAFDTALIGVKMLGYGTSKVTLNNGKEVTVPSNIIAVMKEMGDLYASADPTSGALPDHASYGIAYGNAAGSIGGEEWGEALEFALRNSMDELHKNWVSLDTDATYLKSNQERLVSLDDSFNEQITNIEDMDPADAITQLMWAQYSYNAALRIGMNILSQSLLDYMR